MNHVCPFSIEQLLQMCRMTVLRVIISLFRFFRSQYFYQLLNSLYIMYFVYVLSLSLPPVPDPPVNVQTVTYGTQNIHINWSEPIFGPGIDDLINTLRGDNPEYLVRVDGELTITTNITEVNLTADDGLQPGSLHRIEVGVPLPFHFTCTSLLYCL